MKILFLSYGIYEYDGRMRELIKISKILGDTTCITRAENKENKKGINYELIYCSGFFGYFEFIIKSIMIAFKLKKIDLLFIDNRKAVIPGIIIRLFRRPAHTIQDVRELYLINEINYLTGKIGCLTEQYLIKRSDVVICANNHRAKIMKDYYNRTNIPLVYENIRQLEYTDNVDFEELSNKYKHYFTKDTVRIISTSGCIVSRTNDILVKSMVELGMNYELFLIGGGSKEDVNIIENIIKDNKLDNVYIVDRLNIDELKYFLNHVQIGVVNYHQNDANNKYCASGKIYEYLFEGLPVVTTENITLTDICNTYKVGISDNNYVNAIKKVMNNYSYYKDNIQKYMSKFSVEYNNNLLVQEIKENINYNFKS